MSKVLIIDDEQSLLITLEMLFSSEGYEVVTASDGREGVRLMEQRGGLPDLVITDIRMPDMDGMQVLRHVRKVDPWLPVVLITAQADKDDAIKACNEGAYHFLEKPFQNHKLLQVSSEAVDHARAGRRFSKRRRELSSQCAAVVPIGNSPVFKHVLETAEKAAATDSTILIQGESGTGKELLARYIYNSSSRAQRPFVPVNCGALTETLLESELFGHLKGSFTGALVNKDGLFKVASGGTIFLDEIGDTSPSFQVKLLRVLQEREITPVGSTEPLSVDVRIIVATNRELDTEVDSGRFRRDLYYRLNVIPLRMPALRERRDDIRLLIDYFLERNGESAGHGKRFTQAALEKLECYQWPGNIRELENVIEQMSVLGPSTRIGEEHLPGKIREPAVRNFVDDQPKATPTLDTVETAYINWVMEQVGGSKKEAARILGIDPSTLYRKLSR